MRVLFLAAEAAPIVKVGGLGDVAGSLPFALGRLDPQLDIRLVIPLHGEGSRGNSGLRMVREFQLRTPAGRHQMVAWATIIPDGEVYLIGGDGIKNESPVYQSNAAADAEKYCIFSLAALAFCLEEGWVPEIIHAHDWHTAFALKALRDVHGSNPKMGNTKSILTIHNLPYQGQGAEGVLSRFGLKEATDPILPEWSRGFPLSLGLESADVVTTVSPQYAREIQTKTFGAGLDGYFNRRQQPVVGILNGIDYEEWNPASDVALMRKYDLQCIPDRRENKLQLQQELGFGANSSIPLLAMIGRVDAQKGVGTAISALRGLKDAPWRAVFLGTGDPSLEEELNAFAAENPMRVRALLKYDRDLAHHIYGGADMLLVPSRYEPCGLTQMIGMRYGCIPIATPVGGLVDTILDEASNPGRGTGFLAASGDDAGVRSAVQTALALFRSRAKWRKLQERAMRQDFSWQRSAADYRALYLSLIAPGYPEAGNRVHS